MRFLDRLSAKLGISPETCRNFLQDASRKYKVYRIPKRNGGTRVIAQPSKELKSYQRAFLSLYDFPVHACATGYLPGKSIKDNAQAHAGNPYLLKTDLKNFFNSVKPEHFWKAAEGLSSETQAELAEARPFVNELLFWRPFAGSPKLILSIGAPSSPALSNFCLHAFDEAVQKRCAADEISYTRYVDDLTFSTRRKGELFKLLPDLKKILSAQFGRTIALNPAKTVISSKKHNRHVTGIVINNDGKLSLGREKKRYIKHLVHLFSLNALSEEDFAFLRGYLAFARHIDPEFTAALVKKYSQELMDRITFENNSSFKGKP